MGNAAGAIGNLVRNSASLCQALVDAGGVDAILTVAFTDLHVQPRRIALFSAGNLAVYATCRNAMLVWRQGSLENRMQSLMTESNDKIVVKYARRIQQKLKQPAYQKR